MEEYALYKTLKEQYNQVHWKDFPAHLRRPTRDQMKRLIITHKESVTIHIMIQYLCFIQLSLVKKYANKKGVFLKGDLPILVSTDSADVWANPHYFDLNFSVGSPPSELDPEGQYWGFPLYRWKTIQEDDFHWFHLKVDYLNSFYHLYRLDHIVGFFRLWTIPLNTSPKNGHFVPQGRRVGMGSRRTTA